MGSTQKWFDELYIKNYKKMVTIAMRLGFPSEEAALMHTFNLSSWEASLVSE